jgi:hypothetical protein
MTPRAEANYLAARHPDSCFIQRMDDVRPSARGCQPCQVAFDAEAELVRCSPYSEGEGPMSVCSDASRVFARPDILLYDARRIDLYQSICALYLTA